jgi:hypothetical protein
MSWFRKNLRMGSHLALLALAIQLVLSFSHVHLNGALQSQEYTASIAGADDAGGTPPKSPVAPHDLICAVCTLLQLAGSLVCPAAPALELPQQFDVAPPQSPGAPLLAALPHLPFNARAPPSA